MEEFAKVSWSLKDVKDAVEDLGFEPNMENVSEVYYKLIDSDYEYELRETMISAGWSYILNLACRTLD